MPDDKDLISDFMKQFEDDSPEAAPDNLNSSSEKIEPVQEVTAISESDCPQNQEAPTIQQSSKAENNYPQTNLAISVMNAVTSATCIGKYVQILNRPTYAQVICDANCNPYLCIPNQQTNQYDYIGNIVFEPSGEYAVYQGYQKVGTLRYHSFEDHVWRFVPFTVNAPQQSQSNQYPVPNAQQPKYTFNNVPPEQADSITHNVMAYHPQATVEVNFASPTLKSGSPFIPVDELKGIIDILPE